MKRILILANNDVGLFKFRKELIEELLKENKVYISLFYEKFVKSLIQMMKTTNISNIGVGSTVIKDTVKPSAYIGTPVRMVKP